MSPGAERVRFAPSPTGSLHLGNARTALFNWLVARQTGGRMILRIEDTDLEREQEGSEASILEDLRWLGLAWDEGPDRGGGFGPYRQSERLAIYRQAAERLLVSGRVYRCFCTDAELEAERVAKSPAGRTPRYSGRCRELSAHVAAQRAGRNEPHAIRFRVWPEAAGPEDERVSFIDLLRGSVVVETAELGDPVLIRRDGRPTYNFAVVVDDAAMEISLVLRGDDHLSNTPRQVLIFRALGHRLPEFAHLPMVRGPDGSRLSKRHGAMSVGECRKRGYPPQAVRNALVLLGWSPGEDRTIVSLEEMVGEFDLARVSRSPAVLDPAKLDWISGQHLQRMEPKELGREAGLKLVEAGLLPGDVVERAGGWLEGVAEMLRGSIERLDQVAARCAGLFAVAGRAASPAASTILADEGARRVIETLAHLAADEAPADRESWRALAAKIRATTGVSGKDLYLPLRVAITGEAVGPELDQLVPLITQGSCLSDRIPGIAERARRALGARP